MEVQSQTYKSITGTKAILKQWLSDAIQTGEVFYLSRYPGCPEVIASYDDGSDDHLVFSKFVDAEPLIFNNIRYLTIDEWEEYVPVLSNSNRVKINPSNRQSTSKEDYVKIVREAIAKIKKGIVNKVVLSKVKAIPVNIDVIGTFYSLENRYPNAYVYCFYDPQSGLWMGASPEKLIEKDARGNYDIHSLAGTKSLAQQWTEKEFLEQKLVTEYISDKLKSKVVTNLQFEGPFDLEYGDIKHLKTRITFQSDEDILDIVKGIHPTPAVCGVPIEKAKEIIGELESYDRSYYTGYLGIKDTNRGRNSYIVNLRCMRVTGDTCYIYTGAGIVADSSAEDEWREVEAKADTIMDCLVEYE